MGGNRGAIAMLNRPASAVVAAMMAVHREISAALSQGYDENIISLDGPVHERAGNPRPSVPRSHRKSTNPTWQSRP